MAELPELPPGLPPVERALRGSVDDLRTHITTLVRNNWPGMQTTILDFGPGQEQHSQRISREIDGEQVSITYPPAEAEDKRRDAAFRKIMSDLRTGMPAYDDHIVGDPKRNSEMPRTNADFFAKQREASLRGTLMQDYSLIDEGPSNPLASEIGQTFGVAQSFIGINPQGGRKDLGTFIGINGDNCAGCSRQQEAMLANHCSVQTPDTARLQQLTRLYTVYHELGHVTGDDKRLSSFEKSAHPGIMTKETNREESRADSFATLMFMRELGEEGRAYAELWSVVRLSPDMAVGHHTQPAIMNTIKWAQENKDAFAQMTPEQMFEKAGEIADSTQLSRYSAHLFERYKKDITGETWRRDTRGSFDEQYKTVAHPQMAEYRLQQMQLGQFFGEVVPPNAPVLQEYETALIKVPLIKAGALATLAAHNPLNTEEWRVGESARAQVCTEVVESGILQVARQELERVRADRAMQEEFERILEEDRRAYDQKLRERNKAEGTPEEEPEETAEEPAAEAPAQESAAENAAPARNKKGPAANPF